MAKIVNLYKSKSDIWYYLIAYIEVSVLCLYGDILPSDSKAMDWCKGVLSDVDPMKMVLNTIIDAYK